MVTDRRQQLGQVLVKVQQGIVTVDDLWRKLISFRSREDLQDCINYGLTIGLFRQMPNGSLYWTKKTVAEALAGIGSKVEPDKIRLAPQPKKNPTVARPAPIRLIDPSIPPLPDNLAEGKPLPYFNYAFVAKVARSLVEPGEKFHANHLVSKIKQLGYGAEDLDVRVTDTLKLIARQGYPKGGHKIIERESYGKAWYISRVARTSEVELLKELQGANVQRAAPPPSKSKRILAWATSRQEPSFCVDDLYEAREEVGYSRDTALSTVRGAVNYLLSYTALNKPSGNKVLVAVSRGRYAVPSRKDEVAFVALTKEAPVVSHTRNREIKKARTKLTSRKKELQVRLNWKERQCEDLREKISKIDRELAVLGDD